MHQECPPQVTVEAYIGHLAHKATLPTQGSSENVVTKKQITDERNGEKQTTEDRVQNHSYKVFQ